MEICKYIDHTLLKSNATTEEITKICNEALEYNFASVCINPTNVKLSKKILSDKVSVCTVIGFPLGANSNITKVVEAKNAIEDGADELDVVINIGALKDKKYDYIFNELQAIKKIALNKIVKAIIEISLLTEQEVATMCEIVMRANIDFVKTSTGFSTRGANVNDIKIIKKYLNSKIKIKASGGIRDYKTAIALIDAGASRIGTSSGIEIAKISNKKNK